MIALLIYVAVAAVVWWIITMIFSSVNVPQPIRNVLLVIIAVILVLAVLRQTGYVSGINLLDKPL